MCSLKEIFAGKAASNATAAGSFGGGPKRRNEMNEERSNAIPGPAMMARTTTAMVPCDIVFAGDAIYIPQLRMTDGKRAGFLTILDRTDRVISNPGGAPPEYGADGKLAPLRRTSLLFTHPHGLVVDEEGSIYVAQWNSGQTYPIKLARVPAGARHQDVGGYVNSAWKPACVK
jgi:hypothetical protein